MLHGFTVANPSIVAALAGFCLLLVYYLVVWQFVGRDPPGGIVFPQFAPPDGMAPDAVRYLYAMADDRKVFAAALVDMAVAGYLRIRQDGETFVLERLAGKHPTLALSEAAVAKELFRDGRSVELTPANADCVQDAVIKQAWALLDTCGPYFTSNTGWLAGGIGILTATVVGAILVTSDPGGTAVDAVVLAILLTLALSLLRWLGKRWAGMRRHHGVGSIAASVTASVFALLFVVLVVLMATFGFAAMMPVPATLVLFAGAGLCWLFSDLLKRATPAGAALRDRIAGFKMFLDAAEKDRLEMLNPPDITPTLFEKYLPYAIALDCETRWAKTFQAQAAAAAIPPTHFAPGWLIGTATALGAIDRIAQLGASLGSAAAAATISPPLRPAHPGIGLGRLAMDGLLSGAGFSGGGRGGGGGGGW